MKLSVWVFRFAWLAAWAFWLWLGFGLYRELPRDLGPVVCQVPANGTLSVIGFLGDGDAILGEVFPQAWLMADRERSLSTWSASDGRKLAEVGPFTVSRWHLESEHPYVAMRLGIAIDEVAGREGTPPYIRAFDLRTGAVSTLPAGFDRVLDLHSTRPWIAVAAEGQKTPRRVAIFELGTWALVKSWELNERDGSIQAGYFFEDDLESLLLVVKAGEGSRRLVRCAPSRSSADQIVELARDYGRFSRPRNGRMVAAAWDDSGSVLDVIDCSNGRPIWSTSHLDEIESLLDVTFGPNIGISASGNRLFDPSVGLLDLATRRMVWAPSKADDAWPARQGANEFWVREDWGALVRAAMSTANWTTYSLRSLEDGNLKVRLYDRIERNPSCSLAIDSNGCVFHLPAVVNYPLLALCQAILALPLVLLWAALRWRRKRRMRMATAAA